MAPANIDHHHPASKLRGFFAIVFFANVWQLLLSLLATSLNAFFACFCVESEWQSYAVQHNYKSSRTWFGNYFCRYNAVDQGDVAQGKTLRVTSPRGQQRSTYFLALPVRYALPLILTSFLLHWALSQSLFLTVLATYNDGVYYSEILFLASSPRPLILSKLTSLTVFLDSPESN
jgi:hypothetical protein